MAHLLLEHGSYLSDAQKRARYEQAISRAVHCGATVLDLGCGAGFLGLTALRHGASRVHFVDETAALEIARRAVRNAGFDKQAVYHRKNSFELVLPEEVDVVVCDHVGYFGVDYGVAALLADARRRYLRIGGQLIPRTLQLHLAAVCEPTVRDEVERWRDGRVPADYSWVSANATRMKHVRTLTYESLLSLPVPYAEVHLGVDEPQFLINTVELRCERDGLLDGIGGWFGCTLVDGVIMTNAPGDPERIDRHNIVLPLRYPVQVSRGETITATLMLRPSEHLFKWRIELPDRGLQFDESNWDADLVDGADVKRGQSERPAALNERGRLHQLVLGYCDGQRTVRQIVEYMTREHAALMPSAGAMEAAVLRILGRETAL